MQTPAPKAACVLIPAVTVCLSEYFQRYDQVTQEKEMEAIQRRIRRTVLENYMTVATKTGSNGFQRMLRLVLLSSPQP